jgi:hypothetical protein
MPEFASMLTRVSCARRRCSGTASPVTGAPVAGSINSAASSRRGQAELRRRCRSRSSAPRNLAQRQRAADGDVAALRSGLHTW